MDKAPDSTAHLPDPKFTDGPWFAEHGRASHGHEVIGIGPEADVTDSVIAEITFNGDAPTEQEWADAKLMAAGPEMHDAIEQALDDMAESHCVCEATKQMLHNALAKARR